MRNGEGGGGRYEYEKVSSSEVQLNPLPQKSTDDATYPQGRTRGTEENGLVDKTTRRGEEEVEVEVEVGTALLRSEEGRGRGKGRGKGTISTRKASWVDVLPKTWREPRSVLCGLLLLLVLLVVIETIVAYHTSSQQRENVSSSSASSSRSGLYFDYGGRERAVSSSFGVVAADHYPCSEVGARMLERGGHAVDAAVATALCLGVKNPFASGIGGGAFILIRLSNGTADAIDAREYAPRGAREDMFVSDPKKALKGGLAVAVPTEVLGLHAAWSKYGKLSWKELVMPAAELAEGFHAHPYLVKSIKSHAEALEEFQALGKVFMPDGKVPKEGKFCCRRPQLSKTLRAIAEHGPQVLYTKLASGLAADVQAAGGILTEQDLLSAKPRFLPVVESEAMGMRLITLPPPSSGSVVVSMLKQIEQHHLPVATSGVLGKHWLLEAMKNSFAVRMSLGDPGERERPFLDYDTLSEIVSDLLSSDFAASLVGSTLNNGTRPEMEYGGIHHSMYLPDDNGTSHLSVVDADQNAVSMTTTINTGFGSKVLSESTGILLNNEMDDFSIPGQPNVYGLAPSEANFIRPGKKPLSSMSPLMAIEGGKLRMVVGASGGPMIITSVVQSFLNYFDLGLDPLDAIQSPRLHHQLFPAVAAVENNTLDWMRYEGKLVIEDTLANGLQKFGHTMVYKNGGLGNCQMVVVDPKSNNATAVSDARKDGAPAAAQP